MSKTYIIKVKLEKEFSFRAENYEEAHDLAICALLKMIKNKNVDRTDLATELKHDIK